MRPEHARLVKQGGAISGTLENVVYFGTDTHYYVRPDSGGDTFIVRQQNTRDGATFTAGERIGIAISDDAAQVLRD